MLVGGQGGDAPRTGVMYGDILGQGYGAGVDCTRVLRAGPGEIIRFKFARLKTHSRADFVQLTDVSVQGGVQGGGGGAAVRPAWTALGAWDLTGCRGGGRTLRVYVRNVLIS